MSRIGLAAYGGLALACALFGRTNDDEGWYLYAAHLVWRGSLPYRDFAFTQMPLMPYVYGLPQWMFGESLYVGRATSVVLAVGAAAIAVRIAWRRGGPLAGAIAAVLLAGMPFAAYASAIVKTYALLGLLLTATLWALTAELAAPLALGLAVTFASAAALTRVSAIPFAAVVVTTIGNCKSLAALASATTLCLSSPVS